MPRRVGRSEIHVPIERQPGVPLRIQLERALRAAIQTGRLSPGVLLPSTRVLASDIGVSRGVVVAAYEQLLAEGYLSSHSGSSTVVSHRPTSSPPSEPGSKPIRAPRFDFRPGRPDHALFPRRAWSSALRRVLSTATYAALDYPEAGGALTARIALAAYLNRSRATATCAERVIFCSGFAQGMRLACETLKARGVRRIAVEDPGHAYESRDVSASELELVPVPVDDSGLCVERLARLDVGAVYVTPAHQYPTGAVLSPSRRVALLDWARQRDAFIVEDDYDGEYRYDREPVGALQGLDPDRVIYIGSASKILAPALRIGWLLTPQPLLQDLTQSKLDADRGSPGLDQLALAEFIERGDLDRHLRRTRLVYSRKRAQLANVLGALMPTYPISGVAAGLHLILELPKATDETAIVAEALRGGIHVHGLEAYSARRRGARPGLLLGYCRLSETDMKEGAKALAQVISACSQSLGDTRIEKAG